MTMLLTPQHVLFNQAINPTSYVIPSSYDPNQKFQSSIIPVSSSLALSTSLLEAVGPLKALSYTQRVRTRASDVANSNICKDMYNDQISKQCSFVTTTKNYKTKEKFGEEMSTIDLESKMSSSPCEQKDDSNTTLNLEKIERRAKASIEKLRHILLRVKTRSPESSNTPSESSHKTCEDGQDRMTETMNGHCTQNNIYYGTPTHLIGGQETSDKNLSEQLQNGQDVGTIDSQNTYAQHDAITCTRSTIKFNKDTNVGVVTLVATVRGDLTNQGENMKEKAIILAARALSSVCSSLEVKASSAFSTNSKGTISRVATLKSATQTDDEVQHNCIVEQLQKGEIVEAFEVKKGYGATPFRPVYVVRLLNQDSSISHAIFKPYIPNDNHRYSYASPEYVAYQLGLLLETDMVPPAVMRRDVQVGGKCFALGTIIHFVPDVRTLTRLGPQEWGAESSVYFVSNVHILDALVGSAPRERQYFMEGLHWVRHGRRRPMLLDHPYGIANGKLHPMWNPKNNTRGVQKISHQTLAALRSIDLSLLQEKLGLHVSSEEMERILQRRDQVQSERLLLAELLTKAITKRGQQYVLHDLSKGRLFLHLLTWWNFQPMHACGYGRVQASRIPIPIPILPPEPSPPGIMHHHHGHGMWPATSSTCMQGPHGNGLVGLRTHSISSRPPRKKPRLARWSAAPYLPRRSLEAMATGQGTLPRYGDEGTADVILILKPVEGLPLPPLLLHSRALRRSEFFETRLSERWANSSDHNGPLEITLDKCVNPSTYVRCIQLLYVPDRIKHTAFNDVQDALGILEVAAELLFHDCVDACMRYLEAVPWTLENEATIRGCVASLHLQSSPDLAARLCISENGTMEKPVDVMKDVLGELLALVTNGAPSKARDITERVLLANVHPSASPAFAAVNEVALLKEFQGNLSQLKIQLRKFSNFFSWNAHQVTLACSALRWLLDELFALQIADMSIKIFSEEQELAQLMVSRMYQNPFTETLFQILVRMLQALQKGEVVAPRAVRLGLVSTWLHVIAKLGNDGDDNFGKDNELQQNLEVGLGAIVETLPMLDQEAIFKIWIGACLKCRKAWPDLSEAFDSWCSKLRASQRETDLELDRVPLTSKVCSS